MASKSGGKKKRTVAEVGPVEVVDGYEKVMLEDGGFKRRRVGAKRWERMCPHGRQPNRCKSAGGHRSASTAVDAADARTAGEHRSVSTAVYATDARSAGLINEARLLTTS